MVVDITQHHIDHGVRGDCHNCAVALALKEATGRTDVSVYGPTITFDLHGDNWRTVLLPDEAIDFIEAFDAGEPVAPLLFELEIRNAKRYQPRARKPQAYSLYQFG